MKNEIVKTQPNTVATFEAPAFETEAINTEDISFPRIQVMQPISESVTDGKYIAGDIIDSVSGEKIGDTNQGIEILPLRCRKYYKVTTKVDGKNKFIRTEPIISSFDMSKDWNFIENGEQMQRRPVMEVFVIVPGKDLPFILRISGMSYKGMSKQFYTAAFALPACQRKAPFIRSLILKTKKEKNDKGTYFVLSFANGKMTDAEQYSICSQWYETTKATKIQDDEVDEEQKPTQSPENCGF